MNLRDPKVGSPAASAAVLWVLALLHAIFRAMEAGSVFERLREDFFFRDAITVLNGTVAWDVSGHFDPASCIDLDPFTLYDAEVVSDPLEEAG